MLLCVSVVRWCVVMAFWSEPKSWRSVHPMGYFAATAPPRVLLARATRTHASQQCAFIPSFSPTHLFARVVREDDVERSHIVGGCAAHLNGADLNARGSAVALGLDEGRATILLAVERGHVMHKS